MRSLLMSDADIELALGDRKPQDLAAHIRAAVRVLKAVAAEGKRPTARPSKKRRVARRG
jgi:hypothetical protein